MPIGVFFAREARLWGGTQMPRQALIRCWTNRSTDSGTRPESPPGWIGRRLTRLGKNEAHPHRACRWLGPTPRGTPCPFQLATGLRATRRDRRAARSRSRLDRYRRGRERQGRRHCSTGAEPGRPVRERWRWLRSLADMPVSATKLSPKRSRVDTPGSIDIEPQMGRPVTRARGGTVVAYRVGRCGCGGSVGDDDR